MIHQATATSRDNNNVDIESGIRGGSSNNSIGTPLSIPNEVVTTTTDTSTTTTPPTTVVAAAAAAAAEGSNTTTNLSSTTTDTEAIPASSIRQTAMSGFAGLGFVTSLISMMAEYSATAIQHPAIVISGCLGLILSPYAKFQQEKLTQVKALEQTNSVLEDELKYLKEQHELITKHMTEVNARTTKLRSLQSTLSTIQSTDIQSIDQFEQQVRQAKEIVTQFHQNTQAMILQNLITVMVHCDQNHTMTLEDNEIDQLIHSLESIHNVQFNETKIRQLIIDKNQRSMTSIMEIARHLITNTSSSTITNTTTTGTASTTSLSSSSTPLTTSSNVVTTAMATAVTTSDVALENDTIFSFIEK